MSDAMQLLRIISPARWKNILLYVISLVLSRIFRKPVVLNQPWAATIEPSSICQLSCPECPVGMKQIQRKNMFMSLESFEKILKGISQHTFWLNLYFQGEPLLDDGLCKKIELSRQRKIFVSLSTNALALDENMADHLCQSGLSKIIISLDGSDEDTYLKYRTGGDFQQVINAIEFLHDSKKKLKINTPKIEVQMLVFAYNENQKNKLRDMALNQGANSVIFKSPQFYNGQHADENMPTEKQYQRYKKKSNGELKLIHEKRKICNRLWSTMVINSDGNVTACCYDKLSQYKMGNAINEKATSIWNNALFHQFRKDFLQGRKKDICQNCD